MTSHAARLPSSKWEIIIAFTDDQEPMTMNFGTAEAANEFRKRRLRHTGTKSITEPREVYSR